MASIHRPHSTAAFVQSMHLTPSKFSESKNSTITCQTKNCQPRLPIWTMTANSATAHGIASLHAGTWFKLICGASLHDVAMVRNLCHIYTSVGVDCIDVAAETAIIRAARDGIERAITSQSAKKPLLMISVNDDLDIHFRKAYFDSTKCPADCTRPCEKACPADAITEETGVIEARCYGCGRCLPVCPLGLVDTIEKKYDTSEIRRLLRSGGVDALEIHTGNGRVNAFGKFWDQLRHDISDNLQVVAVSLPNLGTDDVLAMALLYMWQCMRETVSESKLELIWQVDGRPMSGDIGGGTARAAVILAKRVRTLLTKYDIEGHVQLAGGTNWKTVDLMEEAGILRNGGNVSVSKSAAGVAIGGYARKVSFFFSFLFD